MSIGRILIVSGIVLIVVGVLFVAGGRLPFSLGNLPGDINVKRENFSFHFPIVTSILLSVVLTLIFYVIGRFR